jgi:hypothetical protein
MTTTSYTHNQAIQNQVHIVCTHGKIHKHVRNIIILTTSKYIYKIKNNKNGAPFPLPQQEQTLGFQSAVFTPPNLHIHN